jgi:2'-5' RNA ligase
VRRSALIVEVPEAEPLVGSWRARYDWSAQHGVPAHVTVLFPFVPVERFNDELFAELRSLFASQRSFEFELPRVERFPEVAWLAPDPSEPFSRLTELVFERWPEYPPYEGIHETVIPHLTVAEGDVALQDEVEAALTPHLPIATSADDVRLILEDEAGYWCVGPRFALGARGTPEA